MKAKRRYLAGWYPGFYFGDLLVRWAILLLAIGGGDALVGAEVEGGEAGQLTFRLRRPEEEQRKPHPFYLYFNQERVASAEASGDPFGDWQVTFQDLPPIKGQVYLRSALFYAFLDIDTVQSTGRNGLLVPLRWLPTIQGRITLADGVTATEQVEVTVSAETPRGVIEDRPARSQEDGQFYFSRVDPAVYTLHCRHGICVETGLPERLIDVRAGRDFEDIQIRLHSSPRGTWRHYEYLDGLANSDVSLIVSAQNGEMWFGTHRGVSRYDGERFERFLVPRGRMQHLILGINAKHESERWVMTENSVYRFTGKEFEPFRQSEVWREESQNHPRQVPWIDGDKSGVVYFGTNAEEFFRYDGRSLEVREPPETLKREEVRRLHLDHMDRIWWLTDQGFYREGPNGNIVEAYPIGLKDRTVRDVYFSASGSISLATSTGVARVSPEVMEEWGQLHGLPHWDTFSVFEAASGELFVGTEDGIATIVNGRVERSIFNSELLHARVKAIRPAPDGALWIGAGLGVSRYDPYQMLEFSPKDGYPAAHVKCLLAESADTWWLGLDHPARAFYRIQNNVIEHFPEGRLSPRRIVRAIHRDPSNRLWVSAYHGATATLPGKDPGIEDSDYLSYLEIIRDIAHDGEGKVWIATSRGLFFEAELGRAEPGRLPDGQLLQETYSVELDDQGCLWIASDEGIFRHRDGVIEQVSDLKRRRWCDFKGSDQTVYLASNQECIAIRDGKLSTLFPEGVWDVEDILCVYRDSDSRFWVGTEERGVLLFDGQTWSSLDTRDGLRGNRVSSLVGLEDGSVLIGTYYGLNRYRRNEAKPQAVVQQVRGRTTIVPGDRDAEIRAFTEERLSIAYSCQDYKTVPEKRLFRFRIGGDEASWSSASTDRVYEWVPDTPGAYRFQVQAIDRDLNYSDPITLSIRVVHPWYRDPKVVLPFLGVLLVLVGSLGASLWSNYKTRRRAAQFQRALLQQEQTSRKRLEEQNKLLTIANEKAEAANRAKSTFLANMSHEIRTPLNAVLGYARILQNRLVSQPGFLPPLVTIEQNGRNLLGLINEILDLSKIESGQVELKRISFDLRSFLDELERAFRVAYREKGIELLFQTDLEDFRGALLGDASKLRQVLANLLSNALKFTREGSVVLTTSLVPSQASPHPAIGEELRVCFVVSDSGPGIRADEQQSIFQPFEQGSSETPQPGSGLGLAIVRRYVERMGGLVSVASEYGSGAAFTVELPFETAAEGSSAIGLAQPKTLPKLLEGNSMSALVVDDLETNRDVLSEMLASSGVQVWQRPSGQGALEFLEEQAVDVVLMDIRMPGMSGMQAAQLIQSRSFEKRPVLVAVSASVLQEDRESYLKSGFDGFLPKPVQPEALYQCLRALLGVEFATTELDSTSGEEASPLLPHAIAGTLREALRIKNLTQIEEAIAQLQECGPQFHSIASKLRVMLDNLDTKGIQNFLDTCRIDPSNSVDSSPLGE